mmetsp:Transcript_13414/g.25243  ORF Transcript_13414/g.25243 Transcript_13414/m.25243 type:complete len:354 (-) Transcript_13414:3612-4673(-)|eukprot:CAMPEP_0204911416 /NCGR_PEP_ID=MMETSP1397-20131031/9769_1 /ASSEMBLY_ACC=CAM_ASM_000891 /TAXON_ID=49980 /ORGANISM="Climacostomum Climacostomum virens, Strain Stock W-24" /LENGTH=353 /DNA_ID=CAMNT_0052081959 /DNA_START=748 /DNA_END=1809 /DNA_ORIENTATION=+
MAQLDADAFITGLRQETLPEAEQIFKVEDARPPSNLEGDLELPANVKLNRVIDNVCSKKKFQDEAWRAYFTGPECRRIITDFFWYVVCKMFNPDTYEEIEEQLLDRICANYLKLFVNVRAEDKQMFFNHFYDALAQCVLFSLFFAYPKSRSKFNSEYFKSALYQLFSEVVTGVTISNQGYSKWILDMGAGNVLQQRNRHGTEAQLPPVEARETARRKKLDIRYSPLIHRYMFGRRYEAINAVKPWKMQFTSRNFKREIEVKNRLGKYLNMAVEIEKRGRERAENIDKEHRVIEEKLKANHKRYIEQVLLLEENARRVLEEGGHAYADLLVSHYLRENNLPKPKKSKVPRRALV